MGQQCSQNECCVQNDGCNGPGSSGQWIQGSSVNEESSGASSWPKAASLSFVGNNPQEGSSASSCGNLAYSSDGAALNQLAGKSSAARSRKPSYFSSKVDWPDFEVLAKKYDCTTCERRPPYAFSSGAVYVGEWRGHMRHGFGIQTWPDGTRYEGQWVNNQAEGKGSFTHANGDNYIGLWRGGVAHGIGKFSSSDGMIYMGEWRHDVQEGFGTESKDGTTYEGKFHEGAKAGSGVYRWSDGSQYIGSWESNAISGKGVYIGKDGRWFKGTWSDSVMHGLGCYSWPDGREYSGSYAFDKKHGFGSFTWPDGRKHQGFWQSGKQHGRGLHRTVDGLVTVGVWEEGKRKQQGAEQFHRGGLADASASSFSLSSPKGILKASSSSLMLKHGERHHDHGAGHECDESR